MLFFHRDEINNYIYFEETAVVRMQKIEVLIYLGFSLEDIGKVLGWIARENQMESFEITKLFDFLRNIIISKNTEELAEYIADKARFDFVWGDHHTMQKKNSEGISFERLY